MRPFLDGLREVELDAAGLAVREISNGKHKLAFETYPEKLIINLDRAYQSDESLTLKIAYDARPKKGMFFIEPDEGYPNRPRQVWTQGQPDDSAHWFPCFNAPGDKYSSELRVTVNNKYTALSNGRLIEVNEDRKRSCKTFHWRQDEPHASYLFSLIIGEFEEAHAKADALDLIYYIYKGHKDKVERIFGRTPQMVNLFCQRFGHAYPFAKYSQAIVSEFTFGGMENTSATTLTDWVLDWALAKESAARDINYDDLIAHELAHQWWGNLATCKSWQHNWLNEGFATYSEILWQEHALGKDEADFFRLQDYNQYLRQDLGESRRPVVDDRYAYPIELFDRHAYEKGALIVHMLRHMLGDEAFFKATKHYLHKHAFKNVETHDLRIAFEEATGQPLDRFFQQWLYRAGYPEFAVSAHWDRAQKLLRLNVRQQQQVDGETPLFHVPVDIEITTANEKRLTRIMVERAEADYYFPLDSKPLMVIFDKGDHILKTLRFDKSKEEHLYQLKHDSEALGRARAARELASYDDDQIVDALAAALLTDPFWGVSVAAASALGEIKSARARAALAQGYQQSKVARVRRAAIWGLGNCSPDDELIDLLRNVVERDDSDFVVAAALQAIANTKSERAFDLLIEALNRDSYREAIRSSAFIGLVNLKDKRAIPHALAFTEYGRPAQARDAAIRALGELGKGDDKVYDRILELLKDPSWRTRVNAIKALGKLNDKRAIARLKEIEQTEYLDHIKSAARGIYRSLAAQSEEKP